MKRAGLIIVVIAFSTILKAQDMAFKTHTDAGAGVSIDYPHTWEFMENPQTVFILIRPLEEPGQQFRENVNLVVGPSQKLTLKEYTEQAKGQMEMYLSGFMIKSTDYEKINGREYAKIVYWHTTNNLPLQVVYYITLKNDKAYNLTFSAIVKSFDKYEPVFNNIVQSFKISQN